MDLIDFAIPFLSSVSTKTPDRVASPEAGDMPPTGIFLLNNPEFQ